MVLSILNGIDLQARSAEHARNSLTGGELVLLDRRGASAMNCVHPFSRDGVADGEHAARPQESGQVLQGR